MNLISAIKKLLAMFEFYGLKQTCLMVTMILVMAVFDVIGVASIAPFMAILANPGLIHSNTLLATIYSLTGITEINHFLFFLGLVFLGLIVVSLVLKAATHYMSVRFILMTECAIANRLIEGYLSRPYSWYLDKNSANLGKTILSEVGSVISQGLMPLMTLIAQSIVSVGLLALIFYIDTSLAIAVFLLFGCIYGLIFFASSSFLLRIGGETVAANQNRYEIVSEAFGAFKEIKVTGLERPYIEQFLKSSLVFARHQATLLSIAQIPRFVVEGVAFCGLIIVILFLMGRSGGFNAALPIVAIYAFAGYRLMPAAQQIYGSITQIRFSEPAIDGLYSELSKLALSPPSFGAHRSKNQMPFEESINLKSVSFAYPESNRLALDSIDVCIPALSTIGFVGATGSGKTTVIDIILGLLEPQKGSLTIDGMTLDQDTRLLWQGLIGYVPQNIFLKDGTIAENIAFGLKGEEIDLLALEKAAMAANLHNFIINDLPDGYATSVGERGIRLSGGECQRIGIARALYREPKVLILDEATSALDNLTEQAVMDAVNNLGNNITIILIAHRLSTVQLCDNIYLLKKGRIESEGSYDQLMAKSDFFHQALEKKD